jgi:hypothetical protein
VITFIVAPLDRPQIAAPKPPASVAPQLDWLDERLLAHLRDAGSCPTWTLLDIVADEQAPRDRTAGRLLRLNLLRRLKRLRRLGLAYPVGRNWISATKPDPAIRRPTGRRRRRTATRLRSVCAVSAGTASRSQEVGHPAYPLHFQMDQVPLAPSPRPVDAEQTESVPAPELVSAAAQQLARLPRRAVRRWSGWISEDVRSFRNMRVELPGGEQAFVFGVLRGRLVFTSVPDGPWGDTDGIGKSWGVVRADQVHIIKNEHAITLGKRKAGTVERRSELKIATARANGRMPARRGRRGRPRRYPL